MSRLLYNGYRAIFTLFSSGFVYLIKRKETFFNMTGNNQATAPVTLSDKEILDLLASILLSIPQEHLGRAVLEGAFYPFDKAFAASTVRFDPKDYTFTPEELKEIDPQQFHNDLFVQSVVCLAVAGVLFTEIFEMAAGAPVPETAVIDWMVDWLPEKNISTVFAAKSLGVVKGYGMEEAASPEEAVLTGKKAVENFFSCLGILDPEYRLEDADLHKTYPLDVFKTNADHLINILFTIGFVRIGESLVNRVRAAESFAPLWHYRSISGTGYEMSVKFPQETPKEE